MTQDQISSVPNGADPGGVDEGSSLPLRRSGRARARLINHNEKTGLDKVPSATLPTSPSEIRRNPKRKAAPEAFDVPDNLLEASLGPWKENEQSEWPSWIELESDPVGLLSFSGFQWSD